MKGPPKLDTEQLTNYLAGEVSTEERAAVEGWLAQKPSRLVLLDRLAAMWKAVQHRPRPAVDLAALDRSMLAYATSTRSARVRQAEHHGRPVWRWMGVGAVVALIVAGVLFGRYSIRVVEVPSAPEHIYKTVAGQWATVWLDDGTRVALSPQTTLTIASGFGAGSRAVRVDGAALFTVAHAAGAPFTVRAGDAVARVLGTEFLVRKYQDDSVVRVIVEAGKVAVRPASAPRGQANGSEAIVTADAMALCTDSGTITLISGAPVDDYVAQSRGRLVFHAALLRDIVTELDRAYGTHIVIADSSLAERRVTFTATVSALSLSNVLDALSDVVDAHYAKRNDTLVVTPGRRGTPSLRIHNSFTPETSYGR